MDHVVIATLGSLGDLYPMLSVARALKSLGIGVSIAASPLHRHATSMQRLPFMAIGDERDSTNVQVRGEPTDTSAFVEYVILPQLDRLFDDLLEAARGASAIVATYQVSPAHLVAEKLGIPFIACALSPSHLIRKTKLSPRGTPGMAPANWHTAIALLRKRAGLPRRIFPYAGVLNDPVTILGLFPRFLLPDVGLIPRLNVVGYPHLAQKQTSARDDDLAAFCDERTVIFSFGSHVDRWNPDYFFSEAVAACKSLGMKCLYLSRFVTAPPSGPGSDSRVCVRPFVEHDLIFPRGSLLVHHAGLGTLMAACRCAKPMVCVPFIFDQPLHAERMAALVNAAQLPATQLDRHSLSVALEHTLHHRSDMHRALTALMAQEVDGANIAAESIVEILLAGRHGSHSVSDPRQRRLNRASCTESKNR
jgi:UDP:flavonoid glycosyltransferase YjiC (YdhE family)